MPLPPNLGSSIAISPDGTRLAYASGNPTRLFVRRLDQSTATELPGTQGAGAVLLAGRPLGRLRRRHQAEQGLGGRRRRGGDWRRRRNACLRRALGRGERPPRERGFQPTGDCSASPPAGARPRPSWDWAPGKLAFARPAGCCLEARRSCLPPTPRWMWTYDSRSRSSRSAIARGRSWRAADQPPGICRRRPGPAIWSTPTGHAVRDPV